MRLSLVESRLRTPESGVIKIKENISAGTRRRGWLWWLGGWGVHGEGPGPLLWPPCRSRRGLLQTHPACIQTSEQQARIQPSQSGKLGRGSRTCFKGKMIYCVFWYTYLSLEMISVALLVQTQMFPTPDCEPLAQTNLFIRGCSMERVYWLNSPFLWYCCSRPQTLLTPCFNTSGTWRTRARMGVSPSWTWTWPRPGPRGSPARTSPRPSWMTVSTICTQTSFTTTWVNRLLLAFQVSFKELQN